MSFSRRLRITHCGLGPFFLRLILGLFFIGQGVANIIAVLFGSSELSDGVNETGLTSISCWLGIIAVTAGFLAVAGWWTRIAAMWMLLQFVTIMLLDRFFAAGLANFGYEFALVMVASTATLLVTGSGRYGVDYNYTFREA